MLCGAPGACLPRPRGECHATVPGCEAALVSTIGPVAFKATQLRRRGNTSSGRHIAQLNVGRIIAPTDSPELAEFRAALDDINARAEAEAAPGFVWRLQSSSGNATDIRVSEDPNFLENMSVWATMKPEPYCAGRS